MDRGEQDDIDDAPGDTAYPHAPDGGSLTPDGQKRDHGSHEQTRTKHHNPFVCAFALLDPAEEPATKVYSNNCATCVMGEEAALPLEFAAGDDVLVG